MVALYIGNTYLRYGLPNVEGIRSNPLRAGHLGPARRE